MHKRFTRTKIEFYIIGRKIQSVSGNFQRLVLSNLQYYFYLFKAPASITLNVVSGKTDKWKDWRDKNFSGSFFLTEIYNERPVYKVSFILPATIAKLKL